MTALVPTHPGFLVWNPDCYMPRFVHRTLADAKTEAKRLAAANPGQRFYVLVPVAMGFAAPPEVHIHTMNPLPFDEPGYERAGDDPEIPF